MSVYDFERFQVHFSGNILGLLLLSHLEFGIDVWQVNKLSKGMDVEAGGCRVAYTLGEEVFGLSVCAGADWLLTHLYLLIVGFWGFGSCIRSTERSKVLHRQASTIASELLPHACLFSQVCKLKSWHALALKLKHVLVLAVVVQLEVY